MGREKSVYFNMLEHFSSLVVVVLFALRCIEKLYSRYYFESSKPIVKDVGIQGPTAVIKDSDLDIFLRGRRLRTNSKSVGTDVKQTDVSTQEYVHLCEAQTQTEEFVLSFDKTKRYFAKDVQVQCCPEARSVAVQAQKEDALVTYFLGVKQAFTNYIANSHRQAEALTELLHDIHEFSCRQEPRFDFEGVRLWPRFDDPEYEYKGKFNTFNETGDPPRWGTCVSLENSLAQQLREHNSEEEDEINHFVSHAALTTKTITTESQVDDWDEVDQDLASDSLPPYPGANAFHRGPKPDFALLPFGRSTRSANAHSRRRAKESEKLRQKCASRDSGSETSVLDDERPDRR